MRSASPEDEAPSRTTRRVFARGARRAPRSSAADRRRRSSRSLASVSCEAWAAMRKVRKSVPERNPCAPRFGLPRLVGLTAPASASFLLSQVTAPGRARFLALQDQRRSDQPTRALPAAGNSAGYQCFMSRAEPRVVAAIAGQRHAASWQCERLARRDPRRVGSLEGFERFGESSWRYSGRGGDSWSAPSSRRHRPKRTRTLTPRSLRPPEGKPSGGGRHHSEPCHRARRRALLRVGVVSTSAGEDRVWHRQKQRRVERVAHDLAARRTTHHRAGIVDARRRRSYGRTR